jgi:transcription initiation factor TFIID subunit 5
MSHVFTSNPVTSSNPTTVSPHAWEETTGLLSSLIPQTGGGKLSLTNPQAFNASKGVLKLGLAPMSEELRAETERVLREQAMMDRDFTGHEVSLARPLPTPGIMIPTESDLLPRPPTFKTIDVEREVNIVRDARKRIRLEPSVLANIDPSSTQANTVRARALPSICTYSLHDVAEGSVMDGIKAPSHTDHNAI